VSNPNPLLIGGAVEMLVLTRHHVGAGLRGAFLEQARDAVAVLAGQAGYVSGGIAQSTDDADLFVIETRWVDVGAYRRALSSFDVKMRAVPLLSTAVDEPSAYEVIVQRTKLGETIERSGLADDATDVSLGSASAARVKSATP
jgi:hypothetical protein